MSLNYSYFEFRENTSSQMVATCVVLDPPPPPFQNKKQAGWISILLRMYPKKSTNVMLPHFKALRLGCTSHVCMCTASSMITRRVSSPPPPPPPHPPFPPLIGSCLLPSLDYIAKCTYKSCSNIQSYLF